MLNVAVGQAEMDEEAAVVGVEVMSTANIKTIHLPPRVAVKAAAPPLYLSKDNKLLIDPSGPKESCRDRASAKRPPSKEAKLPAPTSGRKRTLSQCSQQPDSPQHQVDHPLPFRPMPPTFLGFLKHLGSASLKVELASEVEMQVGQQREVWTCGQNSYGELAHGDTSSRKIHTIIEFCASKEVVHVAAGKQKAYCRPEEAGTLKRLSTLPFVGNEHTVVLTRNGDVYTAGYNDNGQCGVGSTQRVGGLTLVEKLQGKAATQVHAYNGCEHTLVVLEDGRLMSFGYNYRGQVGL